MSCRKGVVLIIMKKRILSAVLVSGVTLGTATAVHADDFDTQIAAQDAVINNLSSEQAKAQEQVSTIQGQVSSLESQQAELEAQNQELQAKSQQLGAEIQTLSDKIVARNKSLKKQARTAQKGHMTSYINTVLNSKSVSDAINRIVAIREVVTANEKMLAQQESDKAALEAKQAENQEAINTVNANQATIESNKNALATQQAQLEAAQLELSAQLATAQDQKASLQEQKAAAEEAARQAAAAEAAAKAKAEEEAKQQAASVEAAKAALEQSAAATSETAQSETQAESTTSTADSTATSEVAQSETVQSEATSENAQSETAQSEAVATDVTSEAAQSETTNSTSVVEQTTATSEATSEVAQSTATAISEATVATKTNPINDTSNTYPIGQCTWGVKSLASWVGNNWGNANQWGSSAQAAGYSIGYTPVAGAVAVWPNDGGGYGHVALVTSVSSSNAIQVMESNYAGNMSISNYRGTFDPTASTWGGSVYYIYPNA